MASPIQNLTALAINQNYSIGRSFPLNSQQIIAIAPITRVNPSTGSSADMYDVYLDNNKKLVVLGDNVTFAKATLGAADTDVITTVTLGGEEFRSFTTLVGINGSTTSASFVVFNAKFIKDITYNATDAVTSVFLGVGANALVFKFSGNQL